MCLDPPMYGQQPAGVFQSVGPQGRLMLLQIDQHHYLIISVSQV